MNRNENETQHKVTARNWLEYFEENKTQRTPIDWERGVYLEPCCRAAIVASLQRFQVGESGEGKHLKKYAAQTGDREYSRAIELFIAEENYHAQMLGQVLKCVNAPLLHGHWSDAAFIVIRRFSGLEMELMILLVAELIAKRYYRVLRDATNDANLRAMCLQILRDENAHVAFHCDTLNRSFARYSAVRRGWIRFWWKKFYRLVCGIVAWDHRGVLRAAFVSREQWMHDTEFVFEQAAHEIFLAQTVYNSGYQAKETAT
jgi:rubrerythrin